MANFVSIPVSASDDFIINSDRVVACVRISSVSTVIIVSGGTASNSSTDQLTITHGADTASDSVAKSIMDAVVSSFADISKASVVRAAVPAQTITSISFS